MLIRTKNRRTKQKAGYYIGEEILPNVFWLIPKHFEKRKEIMKIRPKLNFSIIRIYDSGKAREVYKYRYKGWERRNKKIKYVWQSQ